MGSVSKLDHQKKLKAICVELIEMLEDYWMVYHKPTRYNALSRHFSKRATRLGVNFKVLIDQLKLKEKVQVTLTETLGQEVWPIEAWNHHEHGLVWAAKNSSRAAKSCDWDNCDICRPVKVPTSRGNGPGSIDHPTNQ